MDSLDALLKVSGLLLPLLWKEGLARRSHRRSGKRIQYVVWHEGQSGLLNPRLRKLKALFSRWMGGSVDSDIENSNIHTAQIFLWNSGTEDLSAEDFFKDNPLFVDAIGGTVVSHKVVLQTDDLGQVTSDQAQRTTIHPAQPRSTQVITLALEHWPPGAGLIVEVRYESDTGKICRLRLAGPVRDLRERAYLGTLWRIDLNKRSTLKAQSKAASFICWLSGAGFLATLVVLLMNIHTLTITSYAYWVTLTSAVLFEWAFIVWNEKHIQLTRKVSRPLAYWLDGPQNV